MDVKKIYMDADALLEGHFKLSSGNHSGFYLQSAKVLEDPKIAKTLAEALATQIRKSNLKIDFRPFIQVEGISAKEFR